MYWPPKSMNGIDPRVPDTYGGPSYLLISWVGCVVGFCSVVLLTVWVSTGVNVRYLLV